MFRRLVDRMPPPVRRNPRLAVSGLVALTTLVLVVVVASLGGPKPTTPSPSSGPSFTYSGTWTLLELQRHVESGDVVAVTTDTASGPAGQPSDGSPALVAKTRDGQVIHVVLNVSTADALAALATLGDGRLLTAEAWQSVAAVPDPGSASGGDLLRSTIMLVVPIVAVGVLIFLFIRLVMRPTGRRESGANFQTIMPAQPDDEVIGPRQGRSAVANARQRQRLVRLDDVAGCDEAKLELTETIEFLRTPERFRRLGASIPRGILLFGPPGTGKTMLAKAVAAEAGVPFTYTSGSEFVEKYVGVGARRMRDLFSQAKRLGRGVIFIDEFDALGKARGGANSHEEREQTLNQLLVELDGFQTSDDIVVIAATNRIDVLDSAVLRPGRFNRKIHVGLPDVLGRRAILDVHSRNKPLAPDADLEGVARKTYGFSGAQLADLLNEAAIFAARHDVEAIGNGELHEGWLKVAVGTGRKRSMDERERSIIAAHEVGHAICGRVHGDKRTVEEISLFAHGEALGVTVSSQEDNDLPSESDLRARLIALMGGRAAEELLFQEVTGGASNDFDKANQIATAMVTRWGMGRDPEATDAGRTGRGSLSFLVARSGGALPSDVQAAATRTIRAILDDAYDTACRTLVAEMERLRRIAAYLVEKERIDGETFAAIFDGALEIDGAEREWRPTTARPRQWTDIAAFADRRSGSVDAPRPAAAPAPVVEPAPAPTGPTTFPVPVAASAPAALVRSRRLAPARGRTTVPASAFRRRLRGLAHGLVRRADGWLTDEPNAGPERL